LFLEYRQAEALAFDNGRLRRRRRAAM